MATTEAEQIEALARLLRRLEAVEGRPAERGVDPVASPLIPAGRAADTAVARSPAKGLIVSRAGGADAIDERLPLVLTPSRNAPSVRDGSTSAPPPSRGYSALTLAGSVIAGMAASSALTIAIVAGGLDRGVPSLPPGRANSTPPPPGTMAQADASSGPLQRMATRRASAAAAHETPTAAEPKATNTDSAVPADAAPDVAARVNTAPPASTSSEPPPAPALEPSPPAATAIELATPRPAPDAKPQADTSAAAKSPEPAVAAPTPPAISPAEITSPADAAAAVVAAPPAPPAVTRQDTRREVTDSLPPPQVAVIAPRLTVPGPASQESAASTPADASLPLTSDAPADVPAPVAAKESNATVTIQSPTSAATQSRPEPTGPARAPSAPSSEQDHRENAKARAALPAVVPTPTLEAPAAAPDAPRETTVAANPNAAGAAANRPDVADFNGPPAPPERTAALVFAVPHSWQLAAAARDAFPFVLDPLHAGAGLRLLIGGLEPGATITNGIEILSGTWMIEMPDLPRARLERGSRVSEHTTLDIELRTEEGELVRRATLQLRATP